VSRANLPQVKGVTAAGQDTVTLTLESGEVLTVTARDGTSMSPDGVLLTDWQNGGPLYSIPSPHLIWQATVWLGLYGGDPDSEEARFDKYLMCLPSITEANWTDGGLALKYVGRTGQRCSGQFTGEVTVNFVDAADLPRDQFTRFPIRVAIQQEEGGTEYVATFRVDHTPTGYAALRALGWLAPLPDLEEVQVLHPLAA